MRSSLIFNHFFRKSATVLSTLAMVWNGELVASGACPVAEPLGGPIRISPPPGSPDPILENLELVMDNQFQLPVYEGGFPDYLSQLLLQTNTYSALGFYFNPVDDRICHVQFGQNILNDATSTFSPANYGTNTLGTSYDGGLTWNYGPPIEQVIPLGGDISQLINASYGPGLFLYYNKNGKRLYGSGQGFDDMIANPPYPTPNTGWLFTYSDDSGKTWSDPQIFLNSTVNWWIIGGPFISTGVGPREFYLTPYPPNNNLIHASTNFQLFPDGIYGNVYYFRSENGGKTFSQPEQVYSMIDDPVWQKEHFDPDFTSDPNYFIFGGDSLSSAHPVVYDQNVLLLPVCRRYPIIGSPEYTGSALDTATDQAVIRSLDNGKTWLPVAGATEQYIFATSTVDPGYLDPFIDGGVGFFAATTGQGSLPLISPFTGRIYLTYQAGNPAASPDPDLARGYPFILLSASSDKGATWSHAVKVNQTPTNLSRGAQCAFSPGVAMTRDGYYVVAYYDFRFWNGFPGEDLSTPLPTDCWLAIYKELDDPTGGSTGVGLDFVEEIRVTPESFDARTLSQSFPEALFGSGGNAAYDFTTTAFEGLTVVVNNQNQLYVMFSMPGVVRTPPDPAIGYKGMFIDTRNLANIYLQRYQFAKPSNE